VYVSTNYRYILCGFLHTKEFAIPTSTPTIHAPSQLVGVYTNLNFSKFHKCKNTNSVRLFIG